jgi:transposase
MSNELHTLITAWLPPACAVHLTGVNVAQEYVLLHLTATAPTARCPCCGVPSSSIHSRYQPRLTDLPWGPRALRLQLTVRKLMCWNATYPRRIFTERLPWCIREPTPRIWTI